MVGSALWNRAREFSLARTNYLKNKALCADGKIRPVYAQLSYRAWDHAQAVGFYAGHVKVGLVSVSGSLYMFNEPFADASGELFSKNIFEAHQEGVNAHLIEGSWADIAHLINLEETQLAEAQAQEMVR